MSIGVGIYLWVFYFVPLTYISVFVSIPYCLDDYSFVVQSEIRKVDSSSSILSQDCFGYLGSFVFPYKLYFCCFVVLSLKNAVGRCYIDRGYIEFVDYFV